MNPHKIISALAFYSYKIVHALFILVFAGTMLLEIFMPIPVWLASLYWVFIGLYLGYSIAYYSSLYLSCYPDTSKVQQGITYVTTWIVAIIYISIVIFKFEPFYSDYRLWVDIICVCTIAVLLFIKRKKTSR